MHFVPTLHMDYCLCVVIYLTNRRLDTAVVLKRFCCDAFGKVFWTCDAPAIRI